MKPSHEGVKVSIMGREFVVACPEEQRQALGTAATYLDQRMREVQKSGRVVGLERCAVMAALNIAHELLAKEELAEITSQTETRIRAMCEKIDIAMHKRQDQGAPSGEPSIESDSDSGLDSAPQPAQHASM
jgi:cell division protein ZapA